MKHPTNLTFICACMVSSSCLHVGEAASYPALIPVVDGNINLTVASWPSSRHFDFTYACFRTSSVFLQVLIFFRSISQWSVDEFTFKELLYNSSYYSTQLKQYQSNIKFQNHFDCYVYSWNNLRIYSGCGYYSTVIQSRAIFNNSCQIY
ncbi:Hypothetical_protein [Hexamita inflata]|uniref:Hypothetical_protein n=1 Tax=Hexamita inflata TaxID=28002 RepID=A0ABP1LJX3_9EUKA